MIFIIKKSPFAKKRKRFIAFYKANFQRNLRFAANL